MKIFSRIREAIWPVLEEESASSINELTVDEITVDEELLEKTFEQALKNYESEQERKKSVEAKSSLFIGTISIITTVIIGVTSVLVKETSFNLPIFVLLFFLFLLTLYMSRTIWFSIKTLERRTYHALSIEDFLISGTKEDYYKKSIVQITNKIRRNYETINCKVDYMTMAQEYFKRAIIVVTLCTFIILLYFISKSKLVIYDLTKQAIDLINAINIGGWNIVIMYSLISLSIILNILLFIKTKKK